jgi:hypothetical protein
MAKVTYDKEVTALLVIGPYNDFISEGGKLWERVRAVAEAKKERTAAHPRLTARLRV